MAARRRVQDSPPPARMARMSTTVVASRHGSSLALMPVAGPPLDQLALRDVLARHGLELVGGSDLLTAHEFIAAEGLDPADAAALADDLRAAGFSARVVNRVELTTSRRVANAMAFQMVGGMVGLLATVTGLERLAPGTGGYVLAGLGALVMAVAALNGLSLARHGGSGLRVAGVARGSSPTRQLTDQLSHLEQVLPSHLSAPLLARARTLKRQALAQPEGRAARELQELLDELRGEADEQAAAELRELRAELARARSARRELDR